MPPEFSKCFKVDCFRKVGAAARYCCHACATAAEASPPYELDPYAPGVPWMLTHSAGCEARSTERGEFDLAGAETHRQAGAP